LSGQPRAEEGLAVSRALEERRAQHKRYKEDVESRGKPFYPFAMFHDTVMSLVVVSVIVGLACIWYFTADEATEPEGASSSGRLGVLYEEKADPGTTSFVPRPDWYFYFLFYLLRIFKWPDTVVLGTVGIPTIALVLLFALPFVDRRRERRISRRPVAVVAAVLTAVSMGVLTYKGAVAEEGTEAVGDVPRWIEENSIPEGEAQEGAEVFAESGCTNCHLYLGSGVANLGAPPLEGVGERLDRAQLRAYVANPRQFGNQVMPVYGESLTEEQLNQIAAFLEASKGQ
jgi:menaquinol-cytochrome c reductase cytochrome b/c subunit